MTDFPGHNRTVKEDIDEDDPVDKMISKTGCLEKHHALQVKYLVYTCLNFMMLVMHD